MKNLDYPKATEYTLPRKNILVVSCIDLRLTDNLVDFLHHDNLQNRYDHFILAGCSLMCSNERHKFKDAHYRLYHIPWAQSLVDHVDLALTLHDIEDVYIVEHQDCGAYKNFLRPKNERSPEKGLDRRTAEFKLESNEHLEFARELATALRDVPYYKKTKEDVWTENFLTVTCFFIDLRGNVTVLEEQDPKKPNHTNPPDKYNFRKALSARLRLPEQDGHKENAI